MVTLTYIGHSAFYLEGTEARVLIDPFITGNPSATVAASSFDPTTILITHAHNDHVGDTLAIARRTGATVITIVELADWLEMEGAPNVIASNHGGTVRFPGGSVKFVPAWHSSSFSRDGGFLAPGVPAGLVVRVDDVTIYFAGDTALFGDMRLIGEERLDVAVLPIGDLFTMGPADALRAVKLLEPGTVIPCHFNTFPQLEQDVDRFKIDIESSTNARCEVMHPGGTLQLANP